jgi:galactokinase/mevalonate kinase-like predicted kinase
VYLPNQEKEKGAQHLCKEVIAEDFPNLGKNLDKSWSLSLDKSRYKSTKLIDHLISV